MASEPRKAGHVRLTFPERGKPVLNIGPGDHTCQQWELTQDQLRALILDGIAQVLDLMPPR